MAVWIFVLTIIVRNKLAVLAPKLYLGVYALIVTLLGFALIVCVPKCNLGTREAPKKGDFLVDNNYLFEVGGKNKGFKQIKDLPASYVVADDIEIGSGNKIPLWLFGFLY